jgi:hypothetical protein
MTAAEDKIMAKSLIETYKTLKEAGGASGGFVQAMQKKAAGSGAAQAAPKPVQAKPLGGSSSVGTSSVVPNAAPSQVKIDKSRSLQNTNLKPGTNITASKPVVDLSKPGIGPGSQGDTGSKNTVAKSISQAVSDTSSYSAQAKLNEPKLSNAPADQKSINNIKTPKMDSAVAAKSAEMAANRQKLGSQVQAGRTGINNKPSSGAPTMKPGTSLNRPSGNYNPTTGTGKPPVQGPANPMMGQKSPQSFGPGAAAAAKRANMSSGGGNYKAAQTPSVKATGNPNAAGGTVPVKPGTPPKPTPKPATTASQTQTKKPGVVQKPKVIVKPAGKSQSAGTQNNMTPAQRAQQNRQVERGNSNKKLIGLGVKTGKVTRNAANSKRPIGSSQLKEGVMNNKQLAEIVKQIREKKLLEIIGKPGPFDPVHPEGKQDSGSPNQYAHRKKSVAEAHGPLVKGGQQGKGYLGGKALVKRSEGQKMRGNQNVYGRNTITMGEQDEEDLGPTETGQTGKKTEKVTVNPKDTTFSARNSTNIKEIKEK